ncbi:MFS general substrate transporter [Teratosphaeria nubilosa]|uniref:MFS general substrate transporter n=1 Tax=Teratosphaeria nubilosa TaxID=161662 RepID=A0A6G1LCQ4_9PEZI|nr:MFS general substrate transporter [Teratosphaeria nubilosa]
MTTQQSNTSARTKLGRSLTGIQIRKRKTNEGGTGNVFVVGFQGPDDPLNPQTWSYAGRVPCTLMIAAIGCVVGLASSIDSSTIPQFAEYFHVSQVVASLGTALFLIGLGCGAPIAGPISETVGRNPVYVVTLALYMIFVMASALSPNIGAYFAFRFIAGLFGSTPITCAGGSISDLWNPLERVFAFPIFAHAAFTGPLIGPVIGGYIAEYLGWRWEDWITLIISGLVLSLVALFLPETYPPILLKWKAQHLRELTGDDRYCGAIEIRQESLAHRLKRALYRPILLTSREPIIMLIALYLAVIYIILFTFLNGYPYIFEGTYGISQGLSGVCFIGIIVGLFGASALVPMIYKWAKHDMKKIEEKGGSRLAPEFRLWYSMLGGAVAIPISLFWMGWTARPDISIWSPLVASAFFGYGILCVFITSYQYVIDAYEQYAASALASISFIRYVAAGVMVIVGNPFYNNLGVPYTCTTLACLSAMLVPVPYVFYKYGPWIRAKSKYAINVTTGS